MLTNESSVADERTKPEAKLRQDERADQARVDPSADVEDAEFRTCRTRLDRALRSLA